MRTISHEHTQAICLSQLKEYLLRESNKGIAGGDNSSEATLMVLKWLMIHVDQVGFQYAPGVLDLRTMACMSSHARLFALIRHTTRTKQQAAAQTSQPMPALPAPAGALAAPEQLTPPQPVAQPLPTPANALAAGLATPIGQTPPPMPGPEPGPVLATHSLAGMQPVQEPDAAMPGADSPAEVVVESPQGATEHDVPEIRPESPAQFRTPERPQLLHSLQMTPEPQAQPTPRPVADDKKACLICEDDLDKKTCEALSCGHATWLHHHFTLSFLPSGLGFEMNRIVFLLSATPAHKLVVFSKLVAGARGCSASIMVAQMGRLSSYTHNICLCTMC